MRAITATAPTTMPAMAPPDRDLLAVTTVDDPEAEPEELVAAELEDVLEVDFVVDDELGELPEDVAAAAEDVVLPMSLVEKGVGSTDCEVAVTLLTPMAER